MGGTQSKAYHPYMRKVNWDSEGSCNFWHNNPMYSQQTKRMLDQDIREIEVFSSGVIKTINKEL